MILHQNTRSFERTVLEELTVRHLRDITAPLLGTALKDPREASSQLVKHIRLCIPAAYDPAATILTAYAAISHGREICLGDVCVYDHAGVRGIGCVWFHVSIDDSLYTCLAPWEVTSDHGHFIKCRVGARAGVVATADLLAPCVYTPASANKLATVLIPAEHRLHS